MSFLKYGNSLYGINLLVSGNNHEYNWMETDPLGENEALLRYKILASVNAFIRLLAQSRNICGVLKTGNSPGQK